VLGVLFGSGLFGNGRLRELVGEYLNKATMKAIAAEHAKGRNLYVVTTNLDTQRTVIWDMGRIAELGTPQSLDLFRDVIAASASIPVVFPPVFIEAEANGRRFKEMHVDGGVTAPVLTLPEAFLFRSARLSEGAKLSLYVLVNDKVENDFELVPDRTINIASRASAAVTKTQMKSVLHETYEFSLRNHVNFNLTYIDKDIPSDSAAGFRTSYMRALYDYGFRKAFSGNFWESAPPGEGAAPRLIASSRSRD
jgi:Patatin-like phospholipase